MDNTTTTSKGGRGMAWLIFLISLVACIGFLIILPEWFWVTLPFLLTSRVKGMDVI